MCSVISFDPVCINFFLIFTCSVQHYSPKCYRYFKSVTLNTDSASLQAFFRACAATYILLPSFQMIAKFLVLFFSPTLSDIWSNLAQFGITFLLELNDICVVKISYYTFIGTSQLNQAHGSSCSCGTHPAWTTHPSFSPHHILGGFNCREFVRDWHNATVPFIDTYITPLQPNSISVPLAAPRNIIPSCKLWFWLGQISLCCSARHW